MISNDSLRAMVLAVCLGFSGAALWPAGSMAEPVKPADATIVDGALDKSLTGQPGDPEKGRKIFVDRKKGNCLACHANSDLGNEPFHGEVGPPIDGVAERWEPAQLRAILVNSKAVFGDGTIMPAFYRVIEGGRIADKFKGKTILSAEEVEDVIAYLQTLKE